MAFDPWADNADEAQTSTPTSDFPANDIKETSVANSDQNYVTVILKGGKGYGAPSISIRGASVPDALAQVENHEADLKKLVEAASRYGKAFGVLVDGPAGAPAAAPSGGQQRQAGNNGGSAQRGKPKGSDEAPEWMGDAPDCDDCDKRKVYVSGFSDKTQKTWHAWDCPGNCRGSREFKNKPGGRR